jgi:Secretion system C-terminal sorting domain
VWLRFFHNGLLGQSVAGMIGNGDWGVSVEEISEVDGFRVYPNPASEVLNIQCWVMSENAVIPSELRVSDVLGRVVYESQVADKITQIDVSSWSNGLYFVILKSEKGINLSKKIIIQR